jgi:hypothetical protein
VLATVGVDVDAVRATVEASFGHEALTRAARGARSHRSRGGRGGEAAA